MIFQGAADTIGLHALVDDCECIARRVAALGFGFERRALILQGCVVPRGLHGCAVNALGARQLASLQAPVLKAFWGEG